MFNKRKAERPKRDHTGRDLSQFGIFNVNGGMDEDGDGDSDLEAELAALSGGATKPKKPARKPIPQAELDAMVAESMKDIGSDEELSGDDDDPDLLNELSEIAGDEVAEEEEAEPKEPSSSSNETLNLLNERLKLYEAAEQAAKEINDNMKVRRFGRAIKTLQGLIKDASKGKAIDNEEIPPIVSIPKKPQVTSESIPETPAVSEPQVSEPSASSEPPVPKSEDTELLALLNERKNQYKQAALTAKKNDDKIKAVKFIKIAKQFENVIEAVQNGQPVDLTKMPGPPEEATIAVSRPAPQPPKVEENERQTDSDAQPSASEVQASESEDSGLLITASTVLEALEQRMAVYKALEIDAKNQNNSSKVRRVGRIIKQFEQAIKLHKAGKPIPVDELPTPPGYGPIPIEGSQPALSQAEEKPQPPKPEAEEPKSPKPEDPSPQRLSGNHMITSRAEKQVVILLAKQKQFKEAALKAKRKGEINEAKEFLRQAKGFDKLIEAARGGLPVDWSSIPVSPEAKSQLDNEYDLVMTEECTEDNSADVDIIARLENQLTKQLKMCLTTRDHFKALGDVAGTNRFERLALNVTKDLDVVRIAHKTPGAKVPKFHYEMKDFSIVKSFTELTDNDLELTILRGINYNTSNPKEIDTYVTFEFPFPQDAPFTDKTATVKDTNNPEYNATFTIPIQRNSRNCQRVFKRHGIKFEVYSKGGWFKSDSLLGTANVKLQQLETQCELHESFDLKEGRKNTGGKLEIRLRLRHPIVTQQVEQLQEKWLIIDQ